jgi:hypothetical protein
MNWVKVSEQFPQIDEEVIAWTEMQDAVLCVYAHKNDFLDFYSFSNTAHDEPYQLHREKYITHWAAIEPPKGNE